MYIIAVMDRRSTISKLRKINTSFVQSCARESKVGNVGIESSNGYRTS